MSDLIYQNIEKALGRGDGFRCAGCGKFTPDMVKTCDCATGVCFRIKDGKSDNRSYIDPTAEAAAAFIVRATKAHEALIASVRSALSFAEDELAVRGDEDDQYDRPAKPLIEALVAALKLAEADPLPPSHR